MCCGIILHEHVASGVVKSTQKSYLNKGEDIVKILLIKVNVTIRITLE